MKVTVIAIAIAFGSIFSPISRTANANPRQDVRTVIDYCSRVAQNRIQYQTCLNHGERLILEKYSEDTSEDNSCSERVGNYASYDQARAEMMEYRRNGYATSNNPVGEGGVISDWSNRRYHFYVYYQC